MDPTRKGQRWILDAFFAYGGMGVLHPESNYFREQLGYNSYDLKRVFDRAKSTQMASASWAHVAKEIEGRAKYWEKQDSKGAARTLYERAMLLYGRVHYSLPVTDPRRKKYLEKLLSCFEKVRAAARHDLSRHEIKLGEKKFHALLAAGKGAVKQPCVILLSGMDMFKENWHKFMETQIVPRGWVGFTLDGPGQGESLTNGLTMTIDNYDHAISSAIDWLSARPEVDPDNIVIMGSSMGSWWGTRAAAVDKRIKAIAANMPCLGEKSILLNQAQPSFVTNLMTMTGIGSYDEMMEFADKMLLDDIVPKLDIPYLMVTGENDELTTLEASMAIYEALRGPKELWVYQHEFHPIGPPANEWLAASLDWIDRVFTDRIQKGTRKQVFITKDGEYIEGTGRPSWWDPA